MGFAELADEALFRANPRYALTPLDGLDAVQLRNALERGLDEAAYGVMLPTAGSVLNVRSACIDTALLVLSLPAPARIPRYLRRRNPAGWIGEVRKLVLDEILEVQLDGEYISGAALLAKEAAPRAHAEEAGLLAVLSAQALLYAEKLDISDPAVLSGRLYCFNRRPFCADAHGELVGPDRVSAFLKLPELEREASFRRHWRRQPSAPAFSGWQNFVSLAPADRRRGAKGRWTCKLYISAHWRHLPETLRRFLLSPTAHEHATGFKVPCDVFGLLRPDNFVVYLRSKAALYELADSLAPALAGIPVQGVPFSSPLSPDGLLSWGADPPKGSDFSQMGDSWRSWLVNQLAADMARGKMATTTGVPPRALALERLRLEGVDVDEWTPPADVL